MDETAAERRARDERETKAFELAIEAARREERVKARLDSHEDDIRELRHGYIELKAAVDSVSGAVGRIEASISRNEAVAKAFAAQAKQTVSTRQFWIGVMLVMASLIGSIIGSGGHL